jgi:hypothetical protein
MLKMDGGESHSREFEVSPCIALVCAVHYGHLWI